MSPTDTYSALTVPATQGGGFVPTAAIERKGPLTLGDLVTLGWRHRFLAVTAALVAALTVIFGTAGLTPMYEAEANLAVDHRGRALDVQIDAESGRVEYGFLNTERDRLIAEPVLRGVIERCALSEREPYASSADPVLLLSERVRVTTSRDSYVIIVGLQDEHPREAERLLQALIDTYLETKLERRSERASGVLSWLSQGVLDSRRRLEAARAEELRFRAAHNILSTDADQNHHALRLRTLNDKRVLLEQELAQARALVQELDLALAAENRPAQDEALLRMERINRHPVVLEQQQLLYRLRDQEVLLAQKYRPKHPRMREIAEQLRAKEGHLHEAIRLAVAASKTRLRELNLQASELDRRIVTETEALATYRSALVGLMARMREVETQQELYERLARKQTEEQVASTLEASQIEIIHPPKAGAKPINIRRTLFAAAALLVGGVVGLLSALVADLLDKRVRRVEDVASLIGREALASVPHVEALRRDDSMATLEAQAPLREAWRDLRASIQLSQRGLPRGRVLLFTSAGPGEGKSTTCLGCAWAFASAGARVLLIDGDLRKPALHERLAIPGTRGFSTMLARDEAVDPVEMGIPELHVVVAGRRPDSPGDLLHSERLPRLLDRFRQDYDLIIIDSPPVGLVSDALVLAEHADQILLVVRDRYADRRTLAVSMAKLRPLADHLLGFVLNDVRDPGGSYRYGKGLYHDEAPSGSRRTVAVERTSDC